MKHILMSLFFGFLFSAYSGQTFEDGVTLFNEKEYSTSAEKFDSILSINPKNIGALYNLGMAKMKTKKWGEAIWAFEKVLVSKPNDLEAKEMIAECHYEIDPNASWEYRLNGIQSSLYTISSKVWAIIAILSSLIMAGMIVLFKRTRINSSRRITGIIGALCIILFIFSMFTGYSTQQHKTEGNFAIVTQKSIESIHEKITVFEGALLKVVNSLPEDPEIRVETEEGELLSFEPNQMSFL